ncbi:MAG: FadR family transcriptional regulator [Myxococcales bacterium]|nr:FadR family transcriptional regulator [Myxococcales bacterium]
MSRTRNIADEIARDLRQQIINGQYEAGDRLPAERELAQTLGVHRSSVREALKKLEQLGLVSTRRGGGTTVQSFDKASLEIVGYMLWKNGRVNRAVLEQILDVEEMLFAGVCYLAVERASEEMADEAQVLMARMSRATSVNDFIRDAALIGEVLTRASGNLVLVIFGNAMLPSLMRGLKNFGPYILANAETLQTTLSKSASSNLYKDPRAASEFARIVIRDLRRLIFAAIDAWEADLDAQERSKQREPTEPESCASVT